MILRELRAKTQLSQTDVARMTGLNLRNYNKYENNVTEPDIATLIKLADFYNTTIDNIVGRPTSLINVAILNNTQREIIERVQNMPDKEQEYTLLFLKMRDNTL